MNYRCLTYLTSSIYTHSPIVAVLARRAVPGWHHKLALAISGCAVEVTGVTGDMHIVVCKMKKSLSFCCHLFITTFC